MMVAVTQNSKRIDNMQYLKNKQGFTLIELLVVIAIIGLLSSVVLASLNSARTKARDAKRLTDFRSVQLAMNLYYDEHGDYPRVPFSCCSSLNHNQHFEDMVTELVNEGFISAVPQDPRHNSGRYYMHYYYGNPTGALLVTYLESIAPTTDGPFNSCRPTTNNWCSHINPSTAFCLCNPN